MEKVDRRTSESRANDHELPDNGGVHKLLRTVRLNNTNEAVQFLHELLSEARDTRRAAENIQQSETKRFPILAHSDARDSTVEVAMHGEHSRDGLVHNRGPQLRHVAAHIRCIQTICGLDSDAAQRQTVLHTKTKRSEDRTGDLLVRGLLFADYRLRR